MSLEYIEGSRMELWVEREALETVVRAAVAFQGIVLENGDENITTAIESIQQAVEEAFEDPLDTTPL